MRRITPAYAGKSSGHMSESGTSGDHPRICGEKRSDCRRSKVCGGITPAYAGKSVPVLPSCPPSWDHPRVCGEKVFLTIPGISCSGSPPRMRGKALACAEQRRRPGITPAYAGKSGILKTRAPPTEDHPRVCGEKGLEREASKYIVGSPPRMRGKD